MGGGSAPAPDPRIGQAALESAQLGRDYLGWMKDQAKVTNGWAAQDRARYQDTFVPLENSYIAKAQAGPDYSKVAGEVASAGATAREQGALAQQQQDRALRARGINPSSGASMEARRRSTLATDLGAAGAENTARFRGNTQAEAINRGEMANAINLGKGMAVNPGTSMGISNGAMSSGFSGAMSGTRQEGSLLNTQYQQRLQGWQANQQANSSLMGGLGSIAGAAIANPEIFAMSSKEFKTDKRPVRGVLDVVKQIPVEAWSYKPGVSDGGEHVGPYAEDFQKATGLGDGRTINLMDAVGVTLGAVKELSDKVDQISQGIRPRSIKRARPDPGGHSATPQGIKEAAA